MPAQSPSDRGCSHPRVLVTRAEGDSAGLRSRLEALGAVVFSLPTITISPPDDWEEVDASLRALSRYDWIAFTSRNAVRATFDRLEAVGLPRALPQAMRVAAVGPATAAALHARGVTVTTVPERATAAALAAEMASTNLQGIRVLVPLGDHARPDLIRGLRDAGAEAHPLVVYRTVPPETVAQEVLARVRRCEVDAITLASPTAVDHLSSLLGEERDVLHQIPLICIGPTTAAMARDLGLWPAAVATEHTMDGLVEAVATLFHLEEAHDRK